MKNPTLKKLFKSQANKGFASLEKNKILKAQEEKEYKKKKLKIKAEAEEFVRNILNKDTVASAIVNQSYRILIYSFNENDDNSFKKRELYDGIIEVLEENEIPFEDDKCASTGIFPVYIVIGGNLES